VQIRGYKIPSRSNFLLVASAIPMTTHRTAGGIITGLSQGTVRFSQDPHALPPLETLSLEVSIIHQKVGGGGGRLEADLSAVHGTGIFHDRGSSPRSASTRASRRTSPALRCVCAGCRIVELRDALGKSPLGARLAKGEPGKSCPVSPTLARLAAARRRWAIIENIDISTTASDCVMFSLPHL